MESINHHERTEEVDDDDQPNDVGTGRSYECMFCKRGFTTAQALGGHMNIHRKDRAKTRPSSSSTKHIDQENTSNIYASSPRVYQPLFSNYPPHYAAAHEVQYHYRTYFPSTSRVTRLGYDQSNHNNNQYSCHELQNSQKMISPCGEDLRMGLSLQFGEDMDQNKSARVGYYEDDHGLDLELRLGHHP